jgi:hypothetical protein
MQGNGGIEGLGRERQGQGIALSVGDQRGELDPFGECSRGVAIGGGEIDSGDPATVPVGQKPGGAPQATSDIENVVALSQAKLLGQLERGGSTPDMKLVYGSQILGGEVSAIFSEICQAIPNRFHQAALSVMLLNSLVHRLVPSSGVPAG